MFSKVPRPQVDQALWKTERGFLKNCWGTSLWNTKGISGVTTRMPRFWHKQSGRTTMGLRDSGIPNKPSVSYWEKGIYISTNLSWCSDRMGDDASSRARCQKSVGRRVIKLVLPFAGCDLKPGKSRKEGTRFEHISSSIWPNWPVVNKMTTLMDTDVLTCPHKGHHHWHYATRYCIYHCCHQASLWSWPLHIVLFVLGCCISKWANFFSIATYMVYWQFLCCPML